MAPHLSRISLSLFLAAGALSLSACATEKYVQEQIAPVSQRLDALEAKLQQTDGTAKSALAEAQAASGQTQNINQRLDQLNSRVDSIDQRLMENQRKRPRN